MTDDQIKKSLFDLCMYGASINAHDPILDAIERLLDKNRQPYDPARRNMEYGPDNLRHEGSLLGERNMFAYIMHVYTTEPAWVWVELLDSKRDQCDLALDIRIHGRHDAPITVQCKTGHLGKSNDLYVHKDWLSGSPDELIAVCAERELIYGGPFTAWKQTFKEGSSATNDKEKWMYKSEFEDRGGWIVDIHENVKSLIYPKANI